jgi:hypothetical protein
MDVCSGLSSDVCAAWVSTWATVGALFLTVLIYGLDKLFARRERNREAQDTEADRKYFADLQARKALPHLIEAVQCVKEIHALIGNPDTPVDYLRPVPTTIRGLEEVRASITDYRAFDRSIATDLVALIEWGAMANTLLERSCAVIKIGTLGWEVTNPELMKILPMLDTVAQRVQLRILWIANGTYEEFSRLASDSADPGN